MERGYAERFWRSWFLYGCRNGAAESQRLSVNCRDLFSRDWFFGLRHYKFRGTKFYASWNRFHWRQRVHLTARPSRSEATSGTNTVAAPIILGGATSPQVFYQALGGTLVVSGTVSGSNLLSLKGATSGLAGTIELDGANTSLTGGVTVADANTVILGNDNALGTGTFTNSSGSSTIEAGGGARTLANNVVFGATTTIGGSNNITFNGNASTSGANSRTLTVNNSALTTFNGTVTINANVAPGTLLVNGTGNTTFNGSIVNGAAGAGILSHGGTGTLTLANANTYSGGTNMSGGLTIANHDGAFGSGNVSLTASNVTLTLQNGVLNNYIASSAAFSLFDGTDTVNLNYTGTDTVNTLTVALATQAPGVYGSAASGAPNVLPEFNGTGTITVLSQVPEPSTLAMIAIGATSLVGAQIRRKRS